MRAAIQASLLVWGAAVLVAGAPQQAYAQTQAAARASFDVPAGPLAPALRKVASTAGIALVFTADQVEGKSTRGLQGQYSIEDAFTAVLSGTSMQAVKLDNGGYVLQPIKTTSVRNDDQSLAPVVVNGERFEGMTENSGRYIAATTSVGGKTAQAIREIPQTVSVVTRQKIDDNAIVNLADAMDSVPGIKISQGKMLAHTYVSRGFTVSTYRIDGGAADVGFGTSADYDMTFYDRIEVLRGADGLYGGAGEPGGAINLVRKRPGRELQVKTLLQAGSWNFKRAELDVGGPLNDAGTLRARGLLAREQKDYFYDSASAHSNFAYGLLEADLTRDTMLTVGASYIDRKSSDQGYGLPASIYGTQLNLPRSLYLSGADDRANKERLNLFSSLQTHINEDWTAKLSFEYEKSRQDRFNYYFSGAINPATGLGMSNGANQQYESFYNQSVDLALTGKVHAFGRKHDVVTGVNWSRQKALSDQLRGTPHANGSIYGFDPRDYPYTNDLMPSRHYVSDIEQYGLYGALRLHLADPVHLIAGGRIGGYKYSWTFDTLATTGALVSSSRTYYNDSRVVTPYLAVTYDLNDTWTAYASMAENFVSQASYQTRSNTPIEPVRGQNYEIGIKGDHFGGKVQSAIALYEIHRNGAAVADGPIVNGADGTSCCYRGTGKIISQGLDAEINGEVADGVQLSASYNFNYNRDRNATGSDTRYNTLMPKHLAKVYGSYQLPGFAGKMKVGGGANMQTSSYRVDGNFRFRQSSYAIWNAFASYEFNDKWSLALNVNNLFDKVYYSTIGYSYYGNFYGTPRNVMLSLRGNL